jgi:hypothetical protein
VLADRDRGTVELAVRGPLPAAFFAVLDEGLNLTFSRYPGLAINRRIPCPGHGGSACSKLFNYERLIDRYQQGKSDIYCDESDETSDIAAMLTGFQSPPGAAMGGVEQVLATQYEKLQADLIQLRTMVLKGRQDHCPSVFTLVQSRRRFGASRYTLRLYCEEPGAWHPLPGRTGCYEFTEPSDWLRKAAPFLARTLRLLAATVPTATSVLGMSSEQLHDQVKQDLEQASALLDRGAFSAVTEQDPEAPRRHADPEADFRQLNALLVQLDPQRIWGGLSYTLTPEGFGLYLCADHRAQYG